MRSGSDIGKNSATCSWLLTARDGLSADLESGKFPDIEKAVLEYVKDMRKDGYAVSLDMIRTQACTVFWRLGIATKDFRASSGWTTHFMRRNGLSLAFSTHLTERKMTLCGTVKRLPVPTRNRAATTLMPVMLRSLNEGGQRGKK
ncbi:hypothetical protein HPB51_024376 [Rhipicephalus microplus]|uniref:HTH CENPB-type domain-containing protein n=1 Tax=Rhipicephalus microplus TaxID=6941 RepID=A0A9J6D7J8_RHIMP|nr:hypothetical protein HPB51_024376 [Rhipicephalus microplus]